MEENIVNELCNLDLYDLENNNYNFSGVVFNTDKHDQPGQHWTCCFCGFRRYK